MITSDDHVLTFPSIFSFLPPSTTIRKYHRQLVSTTCSELGTIYCQIISFANSRRQTEVPEIVTNLLAIRRKLRKAHSMKQNVRYEVFVCVCVCAIWVGW